MESEEKRKEVEKTMEDDVNVFVKYLPADVNDARLRELFAPFGRVVSVKVMVDRTTGTSLGFGYVFFLFFCSFISYLFLSLFFILYFFCSFSYVSSVVFEREFACTSIEGWYQ